MYAVPRWGELHVCSVGEVVGPPYSLETVSPGSGAITGATESMVRQAETLLNANRRWSRSSSIGVVLQVEHAHTQESDFDFDTAKLFHTRCVACFSADHGYGFLVYLWGRKRQVRLLQGICGDRRTSSERHRGIIPDTQFREIRPNAGAIGEIVTGILRKSSHPNRTVPCSFDLWWRFKSITDRRHQRVYSIKFFPFLIVATSTFSVASE